MDLELKVEPPVVELVSATDKRIELTMSLTDIGDRSVDLPIIITQIGTLANQRGAQGSVADGLVASSESMQVSQFRLLDDEQLTAVAAPHIADTDFFEWRSQVFCHSRNSRPKSAHLIAEVTQRFRVAAVRVGIESVSSESGNAEQDAAQENIVAENFGGRKTEGVADRRRLQIFEGACEVISKKGWANASVRDIAKAAKITIPTMYQYISGKEDILYLVTSMCMEEILQYFQERVDDVKEPVSALTDAVTAYFQYIDKNRRYINLLYSETRSLNDENRERIFYLEKKFVKLWEGIIIKGNESGVFSVANTDLAANLIYFLCTAWSLRYWNIGKFSESEVRDHILNMVLHGISLPPDVDRALTH